MHGQRRKSTEAKDARKSRGSRYLIASARRPEPLGTGRNLSVACLSTVGHFALMSIPDAIRDIWSVTLQWRLREQHSTGRRQAGKHDLRGDTRPASRALLRCRVPTTRWVPLSRVDDEFAQSYSAAGPPVDEKTYQLQAQSRSHDKRKHAVNVLAQALRSALAELVHLFHCRCLTCTSPHSIARPQGNGSSAYL